MTILKPGKMKLYYGECLSCGAIFSMTDREVKDTVAAKEYGLTDCPCCSKQSNIWDEQTEWAKEILAKAVTFKRGDL